MTDLQMRQTAIKVRRHRSRFPWVWLITVLLVGTAVVGFGVMYIVR